MSSSSVVDTFDTEKFRILRIRQEKSQAAIAKAIGISAPTIIRIENGRHPSPKIFRKILKYFQLPPEYFLTRTYYNLEELRWSHGLSVNKSASMIGISPPTLSAIETAHLAPRIYILAQIAKVYGVTEDEILTRYRNGENRKS